MKDFEYLKDSDALFEVADKKVSMTAKVITVSVGVVLMAGVAMNIPAFIRQGRREAEKQERLASQGLREVTQQEAEQALRHATPIRDRQGDLMALRWEDVIHNAKYPAGTYFGLNNVVHKGLQGTGRPGVQEAITNHFTGPISERKAFNRKEEWLRNYKASKAGS